MKKILNYILIISILINFFPFNYVQAEETFYLYDLIKNQAVLDNIKSEYVENEKGIDFSQISSETNGKGVYLLGSSKDDKYPIYYYRGDIQNNNIIFANFCWKIVRTTDTGGIKLVYNGTPTNGTCDNTRDNYYIGKSIYNNSYLTPSQIGYMHGEERWFHVKNMKSQTSKIIYGKDFTYNEGIYTLKDTMESTSWKDDYQNIAENYRYTCLNGETTCSTLNIIMNGNKPESLNYIMLFNGEDIDDVLKLIFNENNDILNKNNSTIKNTIDNWYEKNMLDYSEFLEDTIWCNDRSISSPGSWSKKIDGEGFIEFNGRKRLLEGKPSLTCPNENDSFTTSNSKVGNKKLKYPVALLTADEMTFAGGKVWDENSNYYLYTGTEQWSMTPYYFNTYGGVFEIKEKGNIAHHYTNVSLNVRPAISLKNNIAVKGLGTPENPYNIVNSYKMSIDTSNTVLDNYEIKDKLYEENTKVTIDIIKIGFEKDGYKLIGWQSNDVTIDKNEFTMPNHDVTVTPILEKVEVNNPNTLDNILSYLIITFITLSIILNLKKINLRKFKF